MFSTLNPWVHCGKKYFLNVFQILKNKYSNTNTAKKYLNTTAIDTMVGGRPIACTKCPYELIIPKRS